MDTVEAQCFLIAELLSRPENALTLQWVALLVANFLLDNPYCVALPTSDGYCPAVHRLHKYLHHLILLAYLPHTKVQSVEKFSNNKEELSKLVSNLKTL